jgi:hypothetical protein
VPWILHAMAATLLLASAIFAVLFRKLPASCCSSTSGRSFVRLELDDPHEQGHAHGDGSVAGDAPSSDEVEDMSVAVVPQSAAVPASDIPDVDEIEAPVQWPRCCVGVQHRESTQSAITSAEPSATKAVFGSAVPVALLIGVCCSMIASTLTFSNYAPWLLEEHHLSPLDLGLASTGIGFAEIITEIVAIIIGNRWGQCTLPLYRCIYVSDFHAWLLLTFMAIFECQKRSMFLRRWITLLLLCFIMISSPMVTMTVVSPADAAKLMRKFLSKENIYLYHIHLGIGGASCDISRVSTLHCRSSSLRGVLLRSQRCHKHR